YTFRRMGAGSPQLRLQLSNRPPRGRCNQEITWRLAPDQADFRAQVRLNAADEDLVLAEADIPTEVTVASVQGADVRHWSRSGRRLQIWLTRSVSETALELQGWLRQRPSGATAAAN